MESTLDLPTPKTAIKVFKQTRYNFPDCLGSEYIVKVLIGFKKILMEI